jgi:hypothetical protein
MCLRHRPGDQQHVGVARAGDEADAQPLDVVVGIVERVDLQLAAVARTGIDLADGQRLAQDLQQFAMDAFDRCALGVVDARRRLGEDAVAGDLPENVPHQRSCPE